MTRKEFLTLVMATKIEGVSETETREICEKMIASIDRKSSVADAKRTQAQATENATILAIITTTPQTVSEIINANGLQTSVSKVTAILTRLCKEGKIVNTKDKKKSYYSLAK